MKKHAQNKRVISILFLLIYLLTSQQLISQNVVVSGALVGNGSYPDLNSAFVAINGGVQTAANINVSIIANTTETASAILNAGAWNTLSISPSGGATRNITGSLALPLIDLNDADKVIINGLNTGGNALVISNTNAGNALTTTIRLMNGATNNTITNCSVLGSSTLATLGTISFSTSSSVGNSNNIISNCDIGPAGANLPTNAIFSLGSATFDNSNNTIQNCRIYDFFSASIATRGILISTNNTNWIITGNRIFQTGLRTYTTANTHGGIQITSGSAYVITNNIIGYSSATASGTYSMTGTIASLFIGINFAVGTTTATSVQGNTITAIYLTTSGSTSTGSGVLCGINVTGGNVNIGNTSSNLIGGTSGVDLIFSNQTTTGGLVVGINSSSTGTVNISGNYIGGLTSTGTTAAVTGGVTGINISGVATGLSINTNTIGNPTPDNMRCGTTALTTGASAGSGINIVSTLTATNIAVTNNLIRNISSWGASTGCYVRGIWGSLTSSAGIFSVLNNTITNLTSNNLNVTVGTGQIGTCGIIMATGTSCTVSGNYISNIANTGTATTNVIVAALAIANGFSTVVSYNRIWNITNISPGTTLTGPPVACGAFIRSGTNGLTFHNNFISLGNGQSSNTSFIGIWGQHGSTPDPTVQVYYNTINIEGTVTSGALPSFGVVRTDFSTAAKTAPYDVRNNIITNTRSGGTGGHYAIANNYGGTASATGWPANTSNYNVLNANPATVGYWTTDQTFSAWKTASAGDAFSYSGITVNYVNSASDLHLNMGITPTSIESHAQPIVGITNDIDNQTRPGPVGSVNGGGYAPDIGADEIDGKLLDMEAPVITYTALVGTCTTGDRTISVNITDASGVATTGSLAPRIYYKKNSGSYISNLGILATGTGILGTWSFTLSSSALGGVSLGDNISYFFIAQDLSPALNVGFTPSVGLVAANVNAVTTPPTTPSFYLVSALNGTYTVGSSSTYTSLTAAAFSYNNSCLAGPVTYMLTDPLYSTAETFPIIFSNNTYANSTNSLLIRPSTGVSPVITGANSSIIALLGADYIKIDGSNNGSSSKNLTVENTTTTLSTVFFIGNSSLTDAASNITLNNCIITGSIGATTTGGVIIGSGISLGAASDIPNNNMTVVGNIFKKTQNAVFAIGNATSPDMNWNISSNLCGSSITADKLGFRGIAVQNAQLFTVNSNTIAGIAGSVTAQAMAGLLIGAAASNGTVSHNIIRSVNNYNNTTTTGASGIALSSSILNNNLNVYNNMISDITGYGNTTLLITSNGNGIVVTAGGGYKIYHNSVWLNTEQGNAALTSVPAAILITTGVTAIGAIDLRNNIFVNTQTTTTNRYSIYSAQTSNAIFSNIDNNIYSTTGPNIGFITSARANLAAIQTGFGSNLNSSTVTPIFTSTTDLHVLPTSNNAIDDLGTPLGITFDIDNQSRSNTLPDIGADEFTGTGCVGVTAQSLSTTSYTLCSNTQSVSLMGAGGSSGSGIVQAWKVSSTAGGPYTNVSSGTGFSTPNFNTGTLTAGGGTNYYVLTTTCTTASLSTVSNEATVTINATPNTSITSTHTLACQNNSVILTANGTASYLWSTSATTSTIQAVPTASAVYSFTGTAANGCTNVASFTLLYSTNPVVIASSPSTLICLGNQATLTASGANSYTWTDGVTSLNGATVTPSPTILTTYSVIGTNTSGCVSASVNRTINVNSVTLSVAGNTTICPGQTSSLTASGGLTYTWSTGDNTANVITSPVSNTVLTLSGTNSLGCSAAITQSINVGNISISISGPTAVCSGQAVTFTATGGLTYTWNTSVNTTTLSDSPTVATTYSVIGASGSCSNTASKTILVNAKPTIAITGTNSTCSGVTITLTATGGNTYLWSTSSTATNITIAPTVNTNYTVTGTNTLGCSSSASIAVTSNSLPVIAIAQSSTGVCYSTSVTFTGSGANTYTWVGGPINSIYSITPTLTTTYTLNGTSSSGCAASKTVAVTVYSLPVIAVTPSSATVCLLSTTGFTASGAATYIWSGNSTNAIVSYTPSANASYTVIGTSSQGCVASGTVSIVTNTLPVITISPASATVCALSPASFTASGASTYMWNNSVSGSVFLSSSINGITNTVVGQSSQGCSSSMTVGVVNLPLPTIAITPSFVTLCSLSSGIFTVSGATSYTWENASNATTVAITPTVALSYSVSGTGANGCINDASAIVLTNPLPTLAVVPASATVCPNVSANFSASGALSYTWSNGIITSSAIITPSATSVYTVTGTDANGCNGTQTISLVTKAAPVILISPSSTSLCLGGAMNFTASGANTYTWNDGSNLSLIYVSPTVTTLYTVSGKNSLGCSSSSTVNLHIWQLPTVSISLSSSTICAKESVTLTASGANTYTWLPSNFSSPTLTNNPSNTLVYIAHGTDVNGCANSSSVTVFVDKCTGLKANSLVENKIRIYPNPSTGLFTTDFGYEGLKEIRILNSIGAMVMKSITEELSASIDLSDYTKGVYFVNIKTNGTTANYKIVIQ
ncbi:T9SS type A sorting domain-containing protein [Aurantibacillus circumpalustris]|uniref:T9SS type A sorting domain-containing protein n=1 Tax=Aurantibacillus circumpalustris TaxID=3036359 RepID=UPI00295B1498|nr:T9SS type A sorting domain-containing protein [Aurantibacillus circumpalustris]